ncbi:hypothetical protein WR25_22692 isoform A [Diploscapter pachys]|uniref:Uncharacterized protein n=1 Tax=Diploscapter pachys TaxID=2018661 RepID=A0A2A2M165_9BILA|nr:hypothetical protein WR25_22692 isoform A [Diploscapter pachys]
MLVIGQRKAAFEPDNPSPNDSTNGTQNFFDNATSRICTLRNNGFLGLTARAVEGEPISVKTRECGPTRLVKFSPNLELCILQRHHNSIDILICRTKSPPSVCDEFSCSSKSKEEIITVEWVSNSQIVLVTKQVVELHQVIEEKKTTKLVRTTNVDAVWAIYYHSLSILFIANGSNTATILPIVISHSQLNRLKSFDVEMGNGNSRDKLLEQDVTITILYGQLYLMVLRYGRNATATDLALYEISPDTSIASSFKYSLSLGLVGGCGIQIIDNVVVVHHQASKSSLLFDIGLSPHRPSHTPFLTLSLSPHSSCQSIQLYSQVWLMFQPNIVIDPIAGQIYDVSLCIEHSSAEFTDPTAQLRFLTNRVGSGKLFLECLLQALTNRKITLRNLSRIFSDIVGANKSGSEVSSSSSSKSTTLFVIPPFKSLQIEQRDMQSSVFIPLTEDVSLDECFVSNVLLEYLRSLYKQKQPVDSYFLELVVQTLCDAGQMGKLQQLVTYRVIEDSKQLAILLISYAARCPSLFQSAVDILSRRKAADQIIEVYLSNGQFIDAARYFDSQTLSSSLANKICERCSQNKNRLVKYAVLSQLNEKRKGSSPSKNASASSSLDPCKWYSTEEQIEANEQVSTCHELP